MKTNPSDIDTQRLMEATVSQPAHVVLRRFPAEIVILNLKTGQYHGLNLAAGDTLDALLTGIPVRKAADRIAAEYATDVGRVRADVVKLCAELTSRGLIDLRFPDA